MTEDELNQQAEVIQKAFELALGSETLQRVIETVVERAGDQSESRRSRGGSIEGYLKKAEAVRKEEERRGATEPHNAGDGTSPHSSSASEYFDFDSDFEDEPLETAPTPQRRGRGLFGRRSSTPAGIQSQVDKTYQYRTASLGQSIRGLGIGPFAGGAPIKRASDGQTYQVMPPSFGDFIGKPSFQSTVAMFSARAEEKMAQASERGDRLGVERYARGMNRADFIANEAIPIGQAMRDYLYRPAQGLSALGASQMPGQQITGDISMGPLGVRLPFGNAFTKGIEIFENRIGRSLQAGVTMKDMAEIDQALMDQGLNYDDPRFKRQQRSLEILKRFNPSLSTAAALEAQGQTPLLGTTKQVAEFNKMMREMGSSVMAAGMTMDQFAFSIGKVIDIYKTTGGTSAAAARTSAYFTNKMPGVGVDAILNTLTDTPYGQAAMIDQGFQKFEIGAMPDPQKYQAFMTALKRGAAQVGISDPSQITPENLTNNVGLAKQVAQLQGLMGFQHLTPEQFAVILGRERQNTQLEAGLQKYYNVDPKTGAVTTFKADMIPFGKRLGGELVENPDAGFLQKAAGWVATAAGIGSSQGQFVKAHERSLPRSAFNNMMRDFGIRGNKANDLAKRIYLDRDGDDSAKWGTQSGQIRADADRIIRDFVQRQKVGGEFGGANDVEKMVKALDAAAQAAKGVKDSLDSGSYANGSNPPNK